MQTNNTKGVHRSRDATVPRTLEYLVPLLFGLCYATVVDAQSRAGEPAPVLTASSDAVLPEVFITARKVSEPLQDVPMSVTALSSETLERSGAQTIADIGRQVPGLNVVSVGPGQNELVIRGISSSAGADTVGYYIDDVPIESTGNLEGNAMDPALYDLDHVEVLRGPQGTLYGASSMGGTVKYVTRQPDFVNRQATGNASLSGTDGGGLNYEVSGMLNEPLASGVAALRVTAFYRDNDGYIDRYLIDPNNIYAAQPGTRISDVNTEKTYGARLGIAIKLGDAFTITPSFWYQRTDLGAPFTLDKPPGSLDNPIQVRDVSEPITDELSLLSLVIDGSIQGVHITSSTGYRDRTFLDTVDGSGGACFYLCPVPQTYVYPLPFYVSFAHHDFTEEIRGSASVGRVHGLLGLFYSHQDNHEYNNGPIPAGYNEAFGSPFGDTPTFYMTNAYSQIENKAVFGEINVDVTQKLQATVGIRYFDITENNQTNTTGVFNGGTTAETGSSKDTGTTPKYELTYHFTPDALSYATAAKGFRQGGPLGPIPASICGGDLAALGLSGPPTSYKADSLWNYELGGKTTWLDHRLTVNGAAYYIDWNDVQQLIALPTCGFVFTGNFGKAESKGGEIEAQLELMPGLRLTLGAAYNEAKLVSTAPHTQGSSGDTLENAPRWIGSASTEYRWQISPATSGYGRVDFSTSTHQYNNFNKTSIYYVRAGYSLFNARVGTQHKAWDIALFIDNALNKHAETALPLSYDIDLPTQRRISLNQPRTIGLQVRFDLQKFAH